MKTLFAAIGSTKLSLAGFAVLAAGLLGDVPGLVVAPLALLAVNLAAAIALRPALRRGGLGVFHFALLAILLLAGVGRLVHFDGHVEVAEGSEFDPTHVEVTGRGPLNDGAWRRLAFVQGGYQVDYRPQLRRAGTRSEVWLPGETQPRTVGDDTPLVLQGVRLYTTHNKGLAPVLAWHADGADAVQGAVHMPGYPGFDWKQENTWKAPDGREFLLRLRVAQPVPEREAWTLDPHRLVTTLIVEAGGARPELAPGGSVRLGAATLRYERLAGWMGYRIFYDPTMLPLLFVSLAGIAGLAWHLWGRTARLASILHPEPA
jgi:hypothetical protein